MSRRITVRGIIVKDGKLFSVRHKHKDGTPKSFWCTPGGGLDPHETVTEGVIRELQEEVGVTPVVGRLLLIQQFPFDKPQGKTGFDEELEFFFHIENPEDFDAIDLTATTHGDTEIAEFGFIDPKSVEYLPQIFQELDLTELTTKNSPVIITSEL